MTIVGSSPIESGFDADSLFVNDDGSLEKNKTSENENLNSLINLWKPHIIETEY